MATTETLTPLHPDWPDTSSDDRLSDVERGRCIVRVPRNSFFSQEEIDPALPVEPWRQVLIDAASEANPDMDLVIARLKLLEDDK